jgi:hypothetical protein
MASTSQAGSRSHVSHVSHASYTSRAFLASLVLVGAAAAGACSGGSPASPAYAPATDTSSDDASLSSGSSNAMDSSAPSDAAPFTNCGTSPASGSIPADVLAVMSAKCQPCHQNPPLHDAPFPLLTYADVHSLFEETIPKYQEMHALIQPSGSPHMPFGTAPQLTATEFTTLDDWLLACAPPGE